ncbi:MAG TPA: AAA family ATPase [Pyrinomonadaceae bacterium]|jgi:hypothetical protein|nr:AAA family ATPase [Pyrinomonadaceae bacterium]
MVITFYSFKGGVGRSMALVNVGEILADWGYNVILCDWDLEAPGLERYLTADPPEADSAEAAAREAAEVAQYAAHPGLMDLLYEYKGALVEPPEEANREAEAETSKDPSAFDRKYKRVGKLYLRRPSSFAFPVSAGRQRAGSLRLLTAGRRDPNSFKSYAELVRAFDWEDFYKRWAGATYVEFLRQDLTDRSVGGADIVLVDSRTGVTEHGGVATHHLADLVILLSAANEMNLEGTDWMAHELSSPRLKETRGNRDLGILPVPSRIEQTSQKNELVNFRSRFAELFGKYAIEFTQGDLGKFFLGVEIPYMPYYSFYERVAAREGKNREQRLYGAYEFIAESVVQHGLRAGLLTKRPKEVRAVEESGEAATASRVEGTVYLGVSPTDAELASVIVRGLAAERVSVWADADGSGGQPDAERAASEASGYLVLVGREGFDERAQAEFDFALRQQVLRKGCRLVPVLRSGVEQTNLPADFVRLRPVILPDSLTSDDGKLFRRLAAEVNAPAAPSVLPDPIPPYGGRGYYEEHAARFFFGRDDEVREMVRRLGDVPSGRPRWLQVEGINGSGKTSLARAGLIPALRRGWLRGAPKRWLIAKAAVGDDFIESLTTALAHATRQRFTPSELKSRLSRPGGLREAVRVSTPPGHGLLLLLDGVEGVLNDSDGKARLALEEFFQTHLPDALEDGDSPFYLVTTARTEAADAWVGQGRLRTIFEQEARRFLIDAVPRAGLREVVEGPAKLAGLNFEDGLVERVVADASELGAPLAVLGPLLHRLWEKRTGGTLTHLSYQETGGVLGVLQGGLKEVVDGLDKEETECAKRILIRLARVYDAGDGGLLSYASAPVPRAEVLEAGGGGAARRVLNRLLSPPCPVVLSGGGDGLALAHGELLRQPPLRDWVESNRQSLVLRHTLTNRRDEWERYGRDPELLLKGAALKQAAEFASGAGYLSGKEIAYLAESQRASKQAKRKTLERLAYALVLLVALLYVGIVGAQRYRAMSQEQESALRSYRVASSESYLYRARLYLSLMSEDDGGRGGKQIAADALGRVVELNRDTQQGDEREMAQKATAALKALEADDVEGARRILGDFPPTMRH